MQCQTERDQRKRVIEWLSYPKKLEREVLKRRERLKERESHIYTSNFDRAHVQGGSGQYGDYLAALIDASVNNDKAAEQAINAWFDTRKQLTEWIIEDKMPGRPAEALICRYLEGRTILDTADHLDVSKPHIHRIINAGLDALYPLLLESKLILE